MMDLTGASSSSGSPPSVFSSANPQQETAMIELLILDEEEIQPLA
jgi:hypothetical protein